MSVTRRFVIAALSMLCFHGMASAEPSNSPPRPSTPAAIIRLSGEVDDFRRDVLFRQFRKAEAAGAQTVILEIDTYGGMVPSALDITRFLRRQNVHTIAFVNDKAISAGSMIALACNEVVMAPGSVLGDCAPINVNKKSGRIVPMEDTERAKAQSPIVQDFKVSATRNGFNPLMAEALVHLNVSIYLIQDAQGHERAVGEDEYKKLTANDEWKPSPDVANPVNGADTLLTVGPDMAKRLGLSKGTAKSAQELAAQRGYSIVADLSPSMGDRAIEFLSTNEARFVLLVIFLLSLYITLHAPGHGAAEAVAIVSLALLVCVPLMTGYAQWWVLALIVVGLALCAFEILVFPGHGVSLIVGVLMMLVGIVLTFAGRDIGSGWVPHSPESWSRIKNGMKVVGWGIAAAIGGGMLIRPVLPKLPLFRRLILSDTSPGPLTAAGSPRKAGDDVWPFVGTIGVAKTDLRPGGVVQFPYGDDTRNADVVGVSGYIPAGTKVVVQEARGNRIVVKIN